MTTVAEVREQDAKLVAGKTIQECRQQYLSEIHGGMLALALLVDLERLDPDCALEDLQDVIREAARRMLEIGGGGRVREQIAQMIEGKAEALARVG